ncbi:MAG: type II toxin-antitoxin system VapC family toxin [Mycobacteriaceae bacterium]|uniref:type II toxin-antitoxin system VapC family toxin n=1 Tax=Corynebacterium sp. TaxID=1720 RepID=UPI003F968A45
MKVLDASAILAFLHGEPGAERVEQALQHAVVGAANWSEVTQKIIRAGAEWDVARALLVSYGLQVEPVTADDAERAALLWRPGASLSLADRLCLALGQRLTVPVLTADKAWGSSEGILQIR